MEDDRVKEIVLKLARGHVSYELGLQHTEEPTIVNISQIPSFTDDELEIFNSLSEDADILYPEVGSRLVIGLKLY